jgi:hypothetical protein
MNGSFSGNDVARIWLSRAMALEKHLKAVLLFERRAEYDQLDECGAREKLNGLAKKYGHRFASMLDAAQTGRSRKPAT